MIPRWALTAAVVGALGLPLALCVVLGGARLLVAMDDAAGAIVLGRVALALALLFAFDLVLLVVLLGVDALGRRENQTDRDERLRG